MRYFCLVLASECVKQLLTSATAGGGKFAASPSITKSISVDISCFTKKCGKV